MILRARLLVVLTFLFVAAAPAFSQPAAVAVPPARSKQLTVLIVNDDGFDAPGIAAVQKAFASGYRVIVAAPAENQSGVGQGITFHGRISVRPIEKPDHSEWYAINARPATCVRLAVTTLMSTKPDLVVSGINYGENLGSVVFYSGTMGAAREAQILGIPAIAASQLNVSDTMSYDDGAKFLRRLADMLAEKQLLRPGLLLNVNFPRPQASEWKGVSVARLSLTPTIDSFDMVAQQPGFKEYESRYKPATQGEPDTDVTAFLQGYVTITPLGLEQTMTNYREDWRFLESAPTLRPDRSSVSSDTDRLRQ